MERGGGGGEKTPTEGDINYKLMHALKERSKVLGWRQGCFGWQDQGRRDSRARVRPVEGPGLGVAGAGKEGGEAGLVG